MSTDDRRELPAPTPRQLVDCLVAVGLWTGTAGDEELAVEAARFGSESLYAAHLANTLLGAAKNLVLGAEQAAVDDGATAEQVESARHQAYPADGSERGSALAAFLRWQALRLGLALRQVNQADSGPVWLAAAHAADGLQLLLNVCGVTTPDDPQGATLPDDIAGAMDALGHARANLEILVTLAGATLPEPSYAHRRHVQPRPDFTDEQVAMLVDCFDATVQKTGDIIEMLEEYAAAGGRDYDTYQRMLDHLAREGAHFTQGARSALAPDVWNTAAVAVANAAGGQPLAAGMLDALHQRLAMSVLAAVWFAGQHHFVEPTTGLTSYPQWYSTRCDAPRPSTTTPTSPIPTATPDQTPRHLLGRHRLAASENTPSLK